ncbi:MAG TPA: GAF domain-containing protein [Elusimicrobiota bacterium]|jgi:GAF domain-containing protein|nr:GAF domain-containing protein [Elusimicrobiota bacterium]
MTEALLERVSRACSAGKPFDAAAQEVCALLRKEVPRYNWIGVYMVDGKDSLLLKAWDGPKATEHVRIPISKGVCGAAVREAQTIVVDDVKKDPRYLSCFLSTRSEIVVPIFANGKVVGEIDIDSDKTAAFGDDDRRFLERAAAALASAYVD